MAQEAAEEKLVLCDASPLIGLAAAGAFELLRRLFGTVSISRAVFDEVVAGGNKPGAAQLHAAVAAGWMQVFTEPGREPSFAHLGAGEASTLSAALAAKTYALAILDDSLARAAATRHGIAHAGSLGVIVTAKQRGLIRAARPYFERLVKAGFYVPATLMKELLRELGEGA